MPIEVRSLAEWEAAGIPGMLSVVIPAHNEEGHIAETVQHLTAVLRDAGIVHEIVVINDNSSDSTERILATLSVAARSREICSITGPSTRHGPHHGAQ